MDVTVTTVNGGLEPMPQIIERFEDNLDAGSVLMVSQCTENKVNIDEDHIPPEQDDDKDNSDGTPEKVVDDCIDVKACCDTTSVINRKNNVHNNITNDQNHDQHTLSMLEASKDKIWYSSTGKLATMVESGMREIVIGFDGMKVDPESKHK